MGLEKVTSDCLTVNSCAIVTNKNVRTDTTKDSTTNNTNVGKEINTDNTNEGEKIDAENTIDNEDQLQEQTGEFSNLDMDISDESDCLSDSKLICKSNTKDDNKKAKKELHNRLKIKDV